MNETDPWTAAPIELALAVALDRASLAGNWEAVKVLAAELEARRPKSAARPENTPRPVQERGAK